MENRDHQEHISTPKHQSQKKKRIYQIGAIVLGLLLVCYIGGLIYFHQTFLPNTSVNHIDVSSMTQEKAHQVLQEHFSNRQLTLSFIDNQKETISQNDCGITYNQNNHLNDLMKQQNHWLWFTHFFKQESLTLDDAIQVNQEQLTKHLQSLKHMDSKQQVAPTDAQVSFQEDDFTIIKEDNGSTLLLDKFQEAVINAFLTNQNSLDLFKSGAYQLPKIKSTDQNLQTLLELARQYCQAHITYQTTSGKVVLDENELLSWIAQDEDGTYQYDEEFFTSKAKAFVKELAQKINNIGTTRTFQLANNRRVRVSGGNYGLKLKQDEEVQGLIKDILAKKKYTRTPKTSGVQVATSNQGLGNTFVEIDLSQQKMYFVKNGQTLITSDCVTGKHVDPTRRTPDGTYYLYAKQRNRVLRGQKLPNGQYEYESPVDYWMPFNRGVGLHDASWRSRFGGQIYINSGSHGCINLPISVAKNLYNSITVKTPVVVHY